MQPNQAICLKCGVKTGQGASYCSTCGQPLNPGAAICTSCGAAVKGGKGDLNGQDKIVMILVCLFLGGFGIHNFMMGESKKGIFRLIMDIFCGLGAIFALIDLIKICMNTYVVDPDALI